MAFIGQHCGERNTESQVAVEPGLFRDYSPLMYLHVFGWGMGLATNPQYMIRLSLQKIKAARKNAAVCDCFSGSVLFAPQIGAGA